MAPRPYTLLVAPVALVGAICLPPMPVPLHDILTLLPLSCCSPAGHTRLAVNRLSLRDTQGLVGPSKGGGPDSAGVILDMWQVGCVGLSGTTLAPCPAVTQHPGSP